MGNFPVVRWQLLISLALSTTQRASAIQPLRGIDVLNQDHVGFDENLFNGLEANQSDDVQELYLEQRLDHFPENDNDPKETFRQRYLYSKRYAGATSRANAPVYAFLCVGGEGPSLDQSVLIDSVHCSGDMVELARILHEEREEVVHLFALEHRYYGKSYPVFTDPTGKKVSPVTNENLVFLSSRQALADLAHFIDEMNDSHDLKAAKWITFGGSYPGMLSAWARMEYPTLVHAAVSNSAPIQMQVDFRAYNDRVAYDLQYPLVGGSEDCLKVVLDGHHQIADALTEGYHEDVAVLFNVCEPDSLLLPENTRMFLGDGVIEVPAQGNDPTCSRDEICNIEKLCLVILAERNQSTPLEALATVSLMQKGDNCTVLDWNETLRHLASPEAQEDGLRSWLWQTCTEFGFYQTCEEDSLCPFGRGYHPLDVDFEICEKAFGVSQKDVVNHVKESLEHYGGRNMEAQRILSVNGDVDPWSMLALTRSRNELPTHWVKGASHHFWTHAVKDTDGQEVQDAREIIYLKVIQWLEEDSNLVESSTTHAREALKN